MKIEITKCSHCGNTQVSIKGRRWVCAACGSHEGVYLSTRGMYREAINARLRAVREAAKRIDQVLGGAQ